jgi:hypothetical protein
MTPALAAELDALGVRAPKPKQETVNRAPREAWWKQENPTCPH